MCGLVALQAPKSLLTFSNAKAGIHFREVSPNVGRRYDHHFSLARKCCSRALAGARLLLPRELCRLLCSEPTKRSQSATLISRGSWQWDTKIGSSKGSGLHSNRVKIQSTGLRRGKEQADEGSRTENNRGRRMRQWSPNGTGLLSKPPNGTGGETRLQTVLQSINVEGCNGFQQVSSQ